MSTGAIVAIVIGAVLLIALLVFLARRGRERRFEKMRSEAQEHRQEARIRQRSAARDQAEADEAEARAKKARASAEEQAAQARRAEAEAEAKADHARHERGHVEQLEERATELDPDAEDGEGNRRFNRNGEPDRQPEGQEGSMNPTRGPGARSN
jgi:FtsZ-interacting cell division protein ZipA